LDLQGSQTYINLQITLANLLEDSTLLDIYEIKSNEEILIPISFLFNTNARNLRFISNRLYRMLNGETTTLENLQAASSREEEELLQYREFSRVAIEEGFEDISSLFNGIANILLNHVLAYQDAIEDIINDQMYCKPEESLWICLGCGNILSGLCAPERCPVCGVPGGYYDQLTTYE
jgi:rubrerythrin